MDGDRWQKKQNKKKGEMTKLKVVTIVRPQHHQVD